MSGWSNKGTVLHFIELYRSFPALWKVNSKEYCNKFVREQAYAKMVEFCHQFEPSADKQFVVKKINNLRSAFRKELKKVETSKLSGADAEEVYESKLWYFTHLMFIQDQEVPTSSLGSVHSLAVGGEIAISPPASFEISEDVKPIETQLQRSLVPSVVSENALMSPLIPSPHPSHSQSPSRSQGASSTDSSPGPSCGIPSHDFSVSGRSASKPPAAKRPDKRRSTCIEDEEFLNAARARLLLNPTPSPPLDENEAFGKTIALLLRNTSKEQRIYARKLMYEVMAEAELGNLSQESHFIAGPRKTEHV